MLAAARLDHAACLMDAGLYLDAATLLTSFFVTADEILAADAEAELHAYMVTPDAVGGTAVAGGSDAGDERAVGPDADCEKHQDGGAVEDDSPAPLLPGAPDLPEFSRMDKQDARVRDVRLHKLGAIKLGAFAFYDDDAAEPPAAHVQLPTHSSEGSPMSPDAAFNWRRFTCLDELVQSGS